MVGRLGGDSDRSCSRSGSARAIRRLAAEHDLRTVGDFLELRYGRRSAPTIAALLWIGTISILAGQLIGIAAILDVVVGMPKSAGCVARRRA